MIQRIQSVYLFFAALATGLIFIFPFAEYALNNELFRLDVVNFRSIATQQVMFNVIPLTLLVAITMLIALVTIFMYKNRMLQLRMGRLNIFLYLAMLGAIFFYSDSAVDTLGRDGVAIHYQLGAMLPIIAIILTFLANRGIQKDEALVRSADRIR
jgi:hypothetical protein